MRVMLAPVSEQTGIVHATLNNKNYFHHTGADIHTAKASSVFVINHLLNSW